LFGCRSLAISRFFDEFSKLDIRLYTAQGPNLASPLFSTFKKSSKFVMSQIHGVTMICVLMHIVMLINTQIYDATLQPHTNERRIPFLPEKHNKIIKTNRLAFEMVILESPNHLVSLNPRHWIFQSVFHLQVRSSFGTEPVHYKYSSK